MSQNPISRRDFIKMSALLGASVGLLGDTTLLTPQRTFGAASARLSSTAEQVIRTACGPNCVQSCGMLAHVRDDRLIKVEPGDFPDPSFKRICLKGISNAIQRVYSPDRVKYPMKRVGARGEGKFERISWEQAYTEIGAKLIAIKTKYGPEACAWMNMTGNSGILASMAPVRMANIFGGTAISNSGIMSDSACSLGWLPMTGALMGAHEFADLKGSRLIIMFGSNYAETALNDVRFLFDAMDAGARLIVIDPRFSRMAAKADWWIPIRPGTDGALALGMMHVFITEKLYDAAYLRDHTVAPMLVRADTGAFLREGDFSGIKPAANLGAAGGPPPGGAPGGPGGPGGGPGGPGAGGPPPVFMVWDEAKQAVVPLGSIPNPPILGVFRVMLDGKPVECRTAFQELANSVQDMTPEKAHDLCDVPANDIRKLAHLYATVKPAAIRVSQGIQRYFNGHNTFRAIITLGALAGNIGKEHAGVSQIAGLMLRLVFAVPPTWLAPDGKQGKRLPGSHILDAIPSSKPYPIKALWTSAYGLGTQGPNQNKLINEVYPNLDLIVVAEQMMTPQAAYADYVLPVTSYYEEEADLVGEPSYYLQLRRQVIKPLWEAKSDFQIFKELTEHLGLGRYWSTPMQAIEEILRGALDPVLQKVSLDELQQKGVVWVPYPDLYSFADQKFGTPSGRLEFYSEMMLALDKPLPVYQEPLEGNRQPIAQKYSLVLLSCHQVSTAHGTHATLPWIVEVNPEPRVDISAADAQKRGIANGDWVEVFNDRGKVQLRARVTQGIKPGTLNIYEGFWPKQFKSNTNVAFLTHLTPNPVQEAMLETNYSPYDTAVEVKRL